MQRPTLLGTGAAEASFAGMNLVMNRFTGPGRLGLQSMYVGYETADN